MSVADLLSPQTTVAGALPTQERPTRPAEWNDWSEVEQAAFANERDNFLTVSKFWAFEEQRRKRDEDYQKLTGESVASLYNVLDEPETRRAKIDARISELRQKDKRFLTLATEADIESGAIMQARGSAAAYERLTGGIEPGFVSGTAGLVGGLRAGLLDPVNMAAAGFGAGAGKGFLQAVGIDFLLGAAATAATEPFVADWQATVGNKMTAGQVLTDVGVGGLLSGGISAAARGVGKAYRFAKTEALDRMAAHQGLPADGKAALDLMEREAFVRERNPLSDTIEEADNIHRDNIDRAAMAVETEGDFSRFVPEFDEKQLADDLRAGSAIADAMGYVEKASPAPAAAPAKVASAPESLTQFIGKIGGIADESGELKSIGYNTTKGRITSQDGKQYYGSVVHKKGVSLDYVREAAEEAGFIKQGSSVSDLLEAIRSEHGGNKVYADAGALEDARAAKGADRDENARQVAIGQVESAADDLGLKLTADEFEAAMSGIQSGRKPVDAVSDAVERSSIMGEPEAPVYRDRSMQQIRDDVQQAQTGDALRARQNEADALLRDMPDMVVEIENTDGTTARLTVKELMEQNKENERMLAEISSCALGGATTAGAVGAAA